MRFLSSPSIVIPLAVDAGLRAYFIRRQGKEWFESVLLPKFSPVTILALLVTLVLIFAFQAENLTVKWFHVLLIAVPILIQVHFNSALAYFLMHLFRVEYRSPRSADRSEQFFRIGGRHIHRTFRSWLRSGSRHRGGRIDRSTGDAFSLRHRTGHWFQTNAAEGLARNSD